MNNALHLVGGRSNHTPLSKVGRYQAHLLGQRLKQADVHFDKVYSSTARRTIETSEIFSQIIGYPLEKIIHSERILELDQGDWEGKVRSEIYTPEVLAKINSDNWNFAAPNGESQKTVEERMLKWLEEEILIHPEGIFGVSTHGFAIKCCLRGLLNFDPKMTYKITIDNTSLTRLQYSSNGWNLLSLNDTGHLLYQK